MKCSVLLLALVCVSVVIAEEQCVDPQLHPDLHAPCTLETMGDDCPGLACVASANPLKVHYCQHSALAALPALIALTATVRTRPPVFDKSQTTLECRPCTHSSECGPAGDTSHACRFDLGFMYLHSNATTTCGGVCSHKALFPLNSDDYRVLGCVFIATVSEHRARVDCRAASLPLANPAAATTHHPIFSPALSCSRPCPCPHPPPPAAPAAPAPAPPAPAPAQALAASGGVGGGGLLVPMFILVGGFAANEASPLSSATITGGSIANFAGQSTSSSSST
jgi:hypothetical protein